MPRELALDRGGTRFRTGTDVNDVDVTDAQPHAIPPGRNGPRVKAPPLSARMARASGRLPAATASIAVR